MSDNVVIGDRSVEGGRYSVWLIPRDEGPWTLILSGASDVITGRTPRARTSYGLMWRQSRDSIWRRWPSSYRWWDQILPF